jgi:hypothetical protein
LFSEKVSSEGLLKEFEDSIEEFAGSQYESNTAVVS